LFVPEQVRMAPTSGLPAIASHDAAVQALHHRMSLFVAAGNNQAAAECASMIQALTGRLSGPYAWPLPQQSHPPDLLGMGPR
jgi:hypothetical protein